MMDNCHVRDIDAKVDVYPPLGAVYTNWQRDDSSNSEDDRMLEAIKSFLNTKVQKRTELEEELAKVKKELEENKKLVEELQLTQLRQRNWVEFTFRELREATNNFDKTRMLGEGLHGVVYAGFLSQVQVAITVLEPSTYLSGTRLIEEIDIISKHPNIVTLIGACTNNYPELLAFVHEFVPRGSLQDHLDHKNDTPPLSWQTRIRIACEVCSALIFVHSIKPQGIFHGNLNSDNILLDSNYTSKIRDFATRHYVHKGPDPDPDAVDTLITTPKLRNRVAYVDPRYIVSGEFTSHTDVFSYGILLLHLVTGQGVRNIRELVETTIENGDLGSIIDASGEWPFEVAKKIVLLGLKCSDLNEKKRPDLAKVVRKLAKVKKEPKENMKLIKELEPKMCCIIFELKELNEATNNFDPSLKIGEGGCGTVYKGFLRHTHVAIKMLKKDSYQSERGFNEEMETLSKVRHPNLVTLIGACNENPEKLALVYEFVPRGSLNDHLVELKKNTSPLSWQTRICIASDICSALIFLHSTSRAHGDLKPDNILLDSNYVSKLSDFGSCRQLKMTNTTDTPYCGSDNPAACTLAYTDPEYFHTYHLTARSDVYSFGLVLIQLVTGTYVFQTRSLVEKAIEEGSIGKLVDPSAKWPSNNKGEYVEARELADLGLKCSHLVKENRPDLATDAWKVIESLKKAASPN